MDQEEAVYNAIRRGWKDFYMTPVKESKDQKFIYQFKIIRVVSSTPALKLFNRHGYTRTEFKTAPIASMVKEKILGIVKRF